MCIYMVTGTPGSGKSLDATLRIVEELNNNSYVLCNYDVEVNNISIGHIAKCAERRNLVNWFYDDTDEEPEYRTKHFKKANEELYNKFVWFNDDTITPAQLVKFHRKFHDNIKKKKTVVIFDEAGTVFNCRDWSEKRRKKWVKFFSKHRHYGFDIYLITQGDEMIDKQIRDCVETQYIYRNCTNFGVMGKIYGLLGIEIFMRLKVWYASSKNSSNKKQDKSDTRFFRFKKKYAGYYNSFDDIYEDDELFEDDEIMDTNTIEDNRLNDLILKGIKSTA